MSKKVLIVGGVAGGATAAARLRRLDESAEIVVFERTGYVSYANCGLPYYVGGAISSREELIVNTPQKYTGLTGAQVVTGCEVTHVDPAAKTVSGLRDGQSFTEPYDKMISATGAAPVVPDMPCPELAGA